MDKHLAFLEEVKDLPEKEQEERITAYLAGLNQLEMAEFVCLLLNMQLNGVRLGL